jgi:hypothetical protein
MRVVVIHLCLLYDKNLNKLRDKEAESF